MSDFRIDGRDIGPAAGVLIIAEIGVNHDGSVQRALDLVRIAAKCGADAVKLQIFRAAALMHSSSAFAAYQKSQCNEKDPAQMLRRYELTLAEYQQVVEAARAAGLLPLATPFSLPDVQTVQQLQLPAVKIASPDLVNLPLLKRAAGTGRPILASVGGATMDEVQMAATWLRQWRTPFALLHCVSSYPTPPQEANLCWIGELAQQFQVPVGFSDHTTEELTGAMAVAAGAAIVEKHLTYDRKAKGPDHAASADGEQFARYVRSIRQAQVLRGTPGKRVLEIEQDVRRVSRQSLVAGKDLPAGHVMCEDDLSVQRPGTGIPASRMEEVVGRKTRGPIPGGTMLAWEMLGER